MLSGRGRKGWDCESWRPGRYLSVRSLALIYFQWPLTTVCRVPETLPEEILAKMHAPPKPDYPIITPDVLVNYDAFLLGVPTRYGNMPAQWKV